MGLVVSSCWNGEVGSVEMFGCSYVIYVSLPSNISFTILCFMCEDLISMQCIVGSIGMLVVRVEPVGI